MGLKKSWLKSVLIELKHEALIMTTVHPPSPNTKPENTRIESRNAAHGQNKKEKKNSLAATGEKTNARERKKSKNWWLVSARREKERD